MILAVQFGLTTTHCDVGNAFLHSEKRSKPVYCKFAPGMEVDGCKYGLITTSVYGMHDASLSWYETSNTFLVSMGFVRSAVELCLCIFHDGDTLAIIAVAVDDYAIAHNSAAWHSNIQILGIEPHFCPF